VALWRPVATPEASYLLTTSAGRRRSLRGRYYGRAVVAEGRVRWSLGLVYTKTIPVMFRAPLRQYSVILVVLLNKDMDL